MSSPPFSREDVLAARRRFKELVREMLPPLRLNDPRSFYDQFRRGGGTYDLAALADADIDVS